MRNRTKSLLALASLLLPLLWQGCKVFEDETRVPAYICVPDMSFHTPGDMSKGDSTHKLVDVWIFESSKLQGTIGMPALIPIEHSGPTQISLDGGIAKTGQANERIIYPLLKRNNYTIDLQPNEIDTIHPVFEYLDNVKVGFIEDFDGIGFDFELRYKSEGDTIIKINDDRARTPGRNSGLVKLSDTTDQFQMLTTESYSLPGFSAPVFLEVDYNSDIAINFGLYVLEPGSSAGYKVPVVQSFPSAGWNKLYIDLSQEVTARAIGSKFKIYIEVINTSGVAPNLILDNIKLLYL